MTGINVGAIGTLPTPPPGGPVLYGAIGGSNTTSDLYVINPDDGTASSVGPTGFAITGLAFRPSDGVLFGVTSNQSASDPRSLITVDPSTGAGTLVGSLGIGNPIADIAFASDDTLYGYRVNTRTLHTINTLTGAATQVSATAIPTSGFGFGISLNSSDVMYVFPKGTSGRYYIVDESTGGLTLQPLLTGSPLLAAINACSFDMLDQIWASLVDVGSPFTTWVATIDLGSSVITGIGVTATNLDALAWSLP